MRMRNVICTMPMARRARRGMGIDIVISYIVIIRSNMPLASRLPLRLLDGATLACCSALYGQRWALIRIGPAVAPTFPTMIFNCTRYRSQSHSENRES